MEFALVGPIAGLLDEAGTDGVFERVLPLCTVAFLFPQLRVPVVRLPNGGLVGIWPMAWDFQKETQRISDTGMFIVGEQKRWRWSGMRTYRPTSHESAMDHASRSSLWTGSLARNGFLFFVQTVRKIITGRLKALWRGVCEGVRRSGKSMVESRCMGRNSSQQNLEGRPPCPPRASDVAPTERRPPGVI